MCIAERAYSDALAYGKGALGKGASASQAFETQNGLPQPKMDHQGFKEVHSLTLRNAILRGTDSKAFFRRIEAGENPGYLDSRKKGGCDRKRVCKSPKKPELPECGLSVEIYQRSSKHSENCGYNLFVKSIEAPHFSQGAFTSIIAY